MEGLRPARAAHDALTARGGGALKFEGVLFDVDGTLVDSNDAHARAFVEAFAESGFEVAFAEVRRRIGMGSDKLIPELIGRYDESIVERKKTLFKERGLPALRPFPKVKLLLQKLRALDLRLAAASSAAKDELDALLEVTGAKACFAHRTDADDAERSKPDPDIVEAALRKLALRAAQCVMVGDTPYDAEAARRAGVAFVGLRCGGWGAAHLQPALGVYEDPADLLRNLDAWIVVRQERYTM